MIAQNVSHFHQPEDLMFEVSAGNIHIEEGLETLKKLTVETSSEPLEVLFALAEAEHGCWSACDNAGKTCFFPSKDGAIEFARSCKIALEAKLELSRYILRLALQFSSQSTGDRVNLHRGPLGQIMSVLKYLCDNQYITTKFADLGRFFSYRGKPLSLSFRSNVSKAKKGPSGITLDDSLLQALSFLDDQQGTGPSEGRAI